MLSRVLVDLYHLKRVHMVTADKNLSDLLKSKICRLNLKPAVAELHRQREHAETDTTPAATGQRVSLDRRRRSPRAGHALPTSTGGDALDHTFTQTDAVWTTLPDPPSIGFLLECIAYFQLGEAPVTMDALELAKAALPFMSSTLACTTLAACCALGDEQVAIHVMPLMLESLGDKPAERSSASSSSSVSEAAAHANPHHSAASGARSHHGLLAGGSMMLRFIEALRRVGATREAVWRAVAEHCVPLLHTLEGKDLVHLVQLFYEQRMLCYPQLYTAVEAHVVQQFQRVPSRAASSRTFSTDTAPFLTSSQREQMIFYYHELGLPTAGFDSLSTLVYRGGDLESALDIAATQGDLIAPRPHATLFTAHAQQGDARQTHAHRPAKPEPTVATGGEATEGLPAPAQNETGTRAQQQQTRAFLGEVVAIVSAADAQELLEVLTKCAAKHVMHSTLMDAAVARLQVLYFPDGVPSPAATSSPQAHSEDDTLSRTSRDGASVSSWSRSEHGQQLLVSTLTVLLRFENPHFFSRCRQSVADMLETVAAEAATQSARNLSLAYGACTLLPPPAMDKAAARTYRPPAVFFEAVMAQLRRTRDIAPHENHARLLQLVRTVLALEAFGGRELLLEHMPSLTVAATNAPRAVQVELFAALSSAPEAARSLVPTLLRALAPTREQSSWYRIMTPGEVRVLLEALERSRVLTSGSAVVTAQAQAAVASAAAVRAASRPGSGTHALTPAAEDTVAHVVEESTIAAATALVAGIVAYIKEQKARFEPSDLTHHLYTLVQLGYRELDFYVATSAHLLSVAAAHTESIRRAHNGKTTRRLGSVGHVPTSVHDLSLLLYVFTFLLCGVIRITQQIMARLKVSVSQATPRDISLVLYSLVRLQVTRPQELSEPLCERAVAVLSDFSPTELTSVWSSLRAVGHAPNTLVEATRRVLDAQSAPHTGEAVLGTDAAVRGRPLSAAQRVTIMSAIVAVTQPGRRGGREEYGSGQGTMTGGPLGSASARRSSRKTSLVTQLSLMSSHIIHDARDAGHAASTDALHAPIILFPTEHAFAGDAAAQDMFKRAVMRIARTRQLSGMQLSLGLTTLAAMPHAALTLNEWTVLAVQSDRLCRCLGVTTVRAGLDAETRRAHGVAEVLIALCHLFPHNARASTGAAQDPRHTIIDTWPRSPPLPSTHGAASQGCPLPPNLVSYLREQMALIAGAPALRDELRQLLVEVGKGGLGKSSSTSTAVQEASAMSPVTRRRMRTKAKVAATQKKSKERMPDAETQLDTDTIMNF